MTLASQALCAPSCLFHGFCFGILAGVVLGVCLTFVLAAVFVGGRL